MDQSLHTERIVYLPLLLIPQPMVETCSRPGEGTTVTIRIPERQEAAA